MFTGIVEELGTIRAVDRRTDAARLTVSAARVLDGVALGDSIAVDGCCLTVAALTGDGFVADVMAETLARTTIGDRVVGDRVNLERPVTVEARLGGHIVQGHVDGVGTILSRTPGDRWEVVEVALPAGLARYLVDQGSVTVDGVSLTVVSTTDPAPDHIEDAAFRVSLIPETLARTTLGFRAPGDRVNLEVDVLAKYVERLLDARLPAADRPAPTHSGRTAT
jgi:riboflavin synthase